MELPGIVQFRKCTLNNQALAEKTANILNKMYSDGKIPSRQIPAHPDDDFDLLVGEMAYRLFFLDLQTVRNTLLMCSLIDNSGQAIEQVNRLDELFPFLNGQ